MIRPSEELKPLFEHAAQDLLAQSDRDRCCAILSENGIQLASSTQESCRPSDRHQTARVGIWRERIEDGAKWFVRERCEPLRLWADVERIPPKGVKKRVVLFGESAARGYFYDPHFTFAAALRGSVDAAGLADVEIVDLARTDSVLERVTDLMRQAVALEPDLFVVFAGNNWLLAHDPPNFSMDAIASILREGGGAANIRAHCEEVLRGLARTFIKTAARLSAERGIQTIFVLPEFNLLDWHNEKSGQTPFRSSEETTLWEAAQRAATDSFLTGNLQQAETMAYRMIVLDSGTTPCGYEILAQCALRRGSASEARSWLELARDAGLFLPVMRSPRCHGVVQDVLRRETPADGIVLVDLPKVFEDYLSGNLPDRRLFLDYCHLTAEGLRVAAAAVAEQLLKVFEKPPRSWSEISHFEPDIPPRVLAEALLQAAIHNAHFGQGPDIIEFQCREAIRLDPAVADMMLRFVDSSMRRAPSFICASMECVAANAADQGAAALHLFNSLPPLRKTLNLELMQVLVSVLTPQVPTLRERTERLLITEFCVGNGPCDLLQRAHASTSLEDWDWLNGTIFYRARQRRTVFKLVCCRKLPVVLQLTIRSVDCLSTEQLRVLSNERLVAALPVSDVWQTHQIDIPADLLNEGLNAILIEWPANQFTRQDRFRTIGRELELGLIPTVPVIYGQISRLQAQYDSKHCDGCSHEPIFWSQVEPHSASVEHTFAAAAMNGSGVLAVAER